MTILHLRNRKLFEINVNPCNLLQSYLDLVVPAVCTALSINNMEQGQLNMLLPDSEVMHLVLPSAHVPSNVLLQPLKFINLIVKETSRTCEDIKRHDVTLSTISAPVVIRFFLQAAFLEGFSVFKYVSHL